MNSKDLEKYGFKNWIPFTNISLVDIPRKSGAYILRLNRSFGRLVGESDILYIGSTFNLNQRFIENYLGGRGGETTQRIHNYLIEKGYMDKVEVSWILTKDYSRIEKKLREQYEEEHHELPPWNRRM